ncbi:MAG: hypothetical protein K2R98_26820 [Gemmataceae bacterium]|nr:hypothetical protein [Gemmataceae bacterium]
MPCFSGSSQSSCQFRAAIAAQIWALMVDFPVSEWPKTLFFPCRIAVSLVENAVAPMLIHAAIYSAMLEDCSFGRGILVWLVELLIVVVIVVFIVVLVIALGFVMSGAMR